MARIIPTFILVLYVITAQALTSKVDSLRFEILMSSKMLADFHLNVDFINSIEVTPNKLVLLSTADQFYGLGWGGIDPVEKKVKGAISSFAYTPDNLLMIIRNNEICVFDSLGNLTTLFKLPERDMGNSAGK